LDIGIGSIGDSRNCNSKILNRNSGQTATEFRESNLNQLAPVNVDGGQHRPEPVKQVLEEEGGRRWGALVCRLGQLVQGLRKIGYK
jgi:hypothetical protein